MIALYVSLNNCNLCHDSDTLYIFLISVKFYIRYNFRTNNHGRRKKLKHLKFIDNHGSFCVNRPENTSYLYFPLASEAGLKSSVTPLLGGDSKINQDTFLLEPVSSENLHNNRSSRNFWIVKEGCSPYSVTGSSAHQEAERFTPDQEDSELTAGLMWQTLERTSDKLKLSSSVTSFIPVNDNVEIMYVTIKNQGDVPQNLTTYGAIPIYGRSADNIRDHRNVTSMLHRIETTKHGIHVCPTMSFDERGHQPNHKIYYVNGCSGKGDAPVSYYPTVEDFIGEGGTYTHPRAVSEGYQGVPAYSYAAGKEAMGALRFSSFTLAPDESADFILLSGIADDKSEIEHVYEKYNTSDKVLHALKETRIHWKKQVNVDFHTQNPDFDNYMKWVSFQPFLRRLFGCSFLPHHDYGRGGRGWRDLWQDCLSLLLMDPQNVGTMIEKNYGGVRIDGTNATIIGDGDGNFIADRNGIARVWMDHALWPLITTKLYIDQTGDIEILKKQVPYFKDTQAMRGTEIDTLWNDEYGNKQLTEDKKIYTGSILEHLLIQQLTAFYEVGDHNVYRLRGADWNDALDMAAEKGESVAFTCAYAGNLRILASLLHLMESATGGNSIPLLEEIQILLNDQVDMFDNVSQKKEILAEYSKSCRHNLSGKQKEYSLSALAMNLLQKASWITEHIRSQEWINLNDTEGWYNSYYDNHGRSVEGFYEGQVRMMLTGQVFSIMGNVATDEQIRKIIQSADHYLYKKEIGGYRLNTDFHELKFDMGRMFGFAYGEKENGAVFSHMAVMYANALYQRGFAKEGWKVLKSLSDTALDFDTSHIYPGIPEYFRSDGRGMYHYLTGAASWYLLTMITEVFGVSGVSGNLLVRPKLLSEQFDENAMASVSVTFAGKQFLVNYSNPARKDYGFYHISYADCDHTPLEITEDSNIVISREFIEKLSSDVHEITVMLA